MHRLISLSPAVAEVFEELTEGKKSDWFCTHDPVGRKLGSGGGTVHLLLEAWKKSGSAATFDEWVASEKGIILHAGGQSRRLPAYAAEGKAMIPVPVFRWSLGQRIDQILLDLQAPFLEKVQALGNDKGRWLIGSGDVLVEADNLPTSFPTADVICLGVWGEPEQASRHGVFFTPRNNTGDLAFMLQKPELDQIRQQAREHYFLLDVGVWLLSDRAIEILVRRSLDRSSIKEFDLYGEFGPALGSSPHVEDPDVNALSTAIIPLEEGRFYHFGSGRDLISSCLRLQNRVIDQRRLSTLNIKPHPSMFVQNTILGKHVLTSGQSNIWIDNSSIPDTWKLSRDHILTGIPDNDWTIELPEGICLDVVPLKNGGSAWRVYGISDVFSGPLQDENTYFCGMIFRDWLSVRNLDLQSLELDGAADIQQAPLFPVFDNLPDQQFLKWLIDGAGEGMAQTYMNCERISASEISSRADLLTIRDRRRSHLYHALPLLFKHSDRSIVYQLDLEHLADKCKDSGFLPPENRPDRERDLFQHIRDAMFRSRLNQLRGQPHEEEEKRAFTTLADAMVKLARDNPVSPVLDCLDDQIIWARSPARLDLAGGWADTPPYCFIRGGKVVNIAVELNGQPPIQVFVRKREERGIRIRSIDLGVAEEIECYDDLRTFANLGSGFAVPKAALALAGFLPEFHRGATADNLQDFLKQFGTGFELSLLCAIPKGSGLGTSSILAATVLGALNEFCQLGWDQHTIARRVLVLEQMLTSGGGWQDQYGGIYRGLKYLETNPGLDQTPKVQWIDDYLFTDPAFKPNILLYYTGITRVAKSVLGEIVRGMFLNSRHRLGVLEMISEHASHTREILQEGNYQKLAAAVDRSWQLNQTLDSGTNPPEVQSLLQPIQKWIGGCKLLGAGGGGYLLMLARDSQAAQQIKLHLAGNPPNPRARFVGIDVSSTGLQVTRS